MKKIRNFFVLGSVLVVIFLFLSSFVFSATFSYNQPNKKEVVVNQKEPVKHLTTPDSVKAVYMSQCVASTPNFRKKVIDLIDQTELNSVVIDVKDYTGTVSFETGNPEIDSLGGPGCKVTDMQDFIKDLHQKNIYVIGRVTVFQDPLYTKKFPDLAVKKKSDGTTWKDRKGISFIDVGAKPFWDHIVNIAKASHDIGFDEINFDYIRFPSDGDMQNTFFSYIGTTTKKEKLRSFFEYLSQRMIEAGITTSADIFGMTTTNKDDLGIGQVLEYALLNFDYVAPMVYPSHYPPNFNGWSDPNKVPYEIIKFSMGTAVTRTEFLKKEIISKMYTKNASTTELQKNNFYNEKLEKRLGSKQLRPWLQDNDYPVHYTPEMVRKQIQATYDVGLNSWMLWDPGNTYTKEALLSK